MAAFGFGAAALAFGAAFGRAATFAFTTRFAAGLAFGAVATLRMTFGFALRPAPFRPATFFATFFAIFFAFNGLRAVFALATFREALLGARFGAAFRAAFFGVLALGFCFLAMTVLPSSGLTSGGRSADNCLLIAIPRDATDSPSKL